MRFALLMCAFCALQVLYMFGFKSAESSPPADSLYPEKLINIMKSTVLPQDIIDSEQFKIIRKRNLLPDQVKNVLNDKVPTIGNFTLTQIGSVTQTDIFIVGFCSPKHTIVVLKRPPQRGYDCDKFRILTFDSEGTIRSAFSDLRTPVTDFKSLQTAIEDDVRLDPVFAMKIVSEQDVHSCKLQELPDPVKADLGSICQTMPNDSPRPTFSTVFTAQNERYVMAMVSASTMEPEGDLVIWSLQHRPVRVCIYNWSGVYQPALMTPEDFGNGSWGPDYQPEKTAVREEVPQSINDVRQSFRRLSTKNIHWTSDIYAHMF